jgi:hypothetical protein
LSILPIYITTENAVRPILLPCLAIFCYNKVALYGVLCPEIKGGTVDEQSGGREEERIASQAQPEALTPRADYKSSYPTFYANFAFVSHTPDDLTVDFCLMAQPFNANIQEKTLLVPVVVRVIIPPGMADGLVKALQTQLATQSQEREERSIIIATQPKEADPHA